MKADRPLKSISESFTSLVDDIKEGSISTVKVDTFAEACSRISVLFGCLGMAFKFAEKDYVEKVKDLSAAAEKFDNLLAVLDGDVSAGTVREAGSHTRNMLRVIRGVDMVKMLFQNILNGDSLKDSASKAYDHVFAPYHNWAIRKAVATGMFLLPSKSQFLLKFHETETSAMELMENIVATTGPVVEYVHSLFLLRELGTDW